MDRPLDPLLGRAERPSVHIRRPSVWVPPSRSPRSETVPTGAVTDPGPACSSQQCAPLTLDGRTRAFPSSVRRTECSSAHPGPVRADVGSPTSTSTGGYCFPPRFVTLDGVPLTSPSGNGARCLRASLPLSLRPGQTIHPRARAHERPHCVFPSIPPDLWLLRLPPCRPTDFRPAFKTLITTSSTFAPWPPTTGGA